MTVEAFSGKLDVEEFKGALDVEEFTGELDESFISKVADIPKQVGLGVLRGAEEIGETIKDILPESDPSQFLKEPILPDIAKTLVQEQPAKSIAGDFAREGARFLTGFLPASKVLSSVGMASGFLKAMAAGAIADFSVFDPHEARLSNLIQSVPELENPVTEYLQADEDDSKIEGRIKSVLEGAGLGAGIEGIFRGIKMVKGGRLAEEAQPVTVRDTRDVNKEVAFGDTSVGASQVVEPAVSDIAQNTKQVLKSFAREIVDVSGGKSISYIDNLAERSPTAKILRNQLEAKEFSKVPLGADFTQRVSKNTGLFVTQVKAAVRGVQTRFRGKIPKQVDDNIVAGLRGETVSGAAKTAVSALRNTLDQVVSYARTGDASVSLNDAIRTREPIIDLGYIENWFPRNYIIGGLKGKAKKAGKLSLSTDEGANAFIKVLGRHGIEATEADDIVAKILNQEGILDGTKSEIRFTPGPKGLTTRKTTSELSRKLIDIPDKELEPFLHDDAVGSINDYIQHIVKRVEVARIAGQGGGKLQNAIENITIEARQSGKPITPGERDRLVDIVNAQQGTYHPLKKQWMRNAYKYNNTYQYIRTLPLATLSSLSEPFVVIMRGRTGSAVKAIPGTMSHVIRESVRTMFKGMPQAQATKFAESIGLATDQMISERMSAIFGGEVTKVGNAFFKLIGLHQWTRVNRVWGAWTTPIMIQDNLKDLIKFEKKTGVAIPLAANKKNLGKLLPNKRFDELVELGIEPREGMRWIREGASSADPFVKKIEDAAIRFTNEVVMSPRVANMPMLSSRPSLQPMFQLKKFQISFGNTVVKRIFQQIGSRGLKEGSVNAAKIAAVGSLMIATAMFANRVREQAKYGDKGNPKFKNESPEKEMLRALDRTGMTGIFQIGMDIGFAHRFGSTGPEQALGPTVTQLEGLREGVSRAIEGNQGKLQREVVTAIPFVNVSKKTREPVKKAIFGKTTKRGR